MLRQYSAIPHLEVEQRQFRNELTAPCLNRVVSGVADKTPAEKIEKAFDDAHVVISNYLEPGPRNAEATLEQLIAIWDRTELQEAIVQLLQAEGALL
jgi:hypothetical protein